MFMNQPHILVVDDEVAIRNVLRDFLLKRGYAVTCAGTAKEAQQLLDHLSFQLIILDVALEDADGLDLLVIFKKKYPLLPVMMLTGLGFDDELIQESLAKQASCCISKISPLDELLQEVRRVLGDNAGSPPNETRPQTPESSA
jgi:DNA-binding response OmpR family regulator